MSAACDVLLLSVSAGAGHVRAAEAIRAAARAQHAGLVVEHLDIMDMSPRLFRTLYIGSYLKLINRNPALWGYLYHATDRPRPRSIMTRMREAVERFNTRKLRDRIRSLRPRVIVCTHFLPAQLLARMRRLGTCHAPTWVVVTDFDIHLLWVHQGLTGYCAASAEVASRMHERGLGDCQIVVTGIPIDPVFASPPDRMACAAELGVDPGTTTFLLMSGGHGVGNIEAIAARILAMPGSFQLIVMAGRNAAMLGSLRALAVQHPGRLFPCGFTSVPERIMVCSDLIISKPGGLSTSECLALGIPMLVVAPIPGQEERNADHVLEHGAAMKAHDMAGIEHRLRRVLTEPDLLPRLAANAKAIGRSRAAFDVLSTVCGS